MTWRVLATAPEQFIAELWCELLQDHGVPARVHPGDAMSYLGVLNRPCRVIVAAERLPDARRRLAEHVAALAEASWDERESEEDVADAS